MRERRFEEHVGDGVHASFDGYQIWLRAERDGRTHEIAVEQDTFDGIDRYLRRLRERLAAERVGVHG